MRFPMVVENRPKYPVFARWKSWFTGTTALKESITLIRLMDSYSPESAATESWAADVDATGEIMCYVEGTVLTIAGNGSGKIAANEDSNSMFEGFNSITEIEGLRLLDTSSVVNMSYMFNMCRKLTHLDVSGFNTSKTTSMERMFSYTALRSLDLGNFNTSNVTTMVSMFQNCESLIELDLGSFDTSKVTSFNMMFYWCENLVKLNLSSFNTGSVKNMSSMFYYCLSLASLDLSSFDTSNVTLFESMFRYCRRLQELDLRSFNTSNAKRMGYMFQECNSMTAIYVSDGWDTSNATSISRMFDGCGVSGVTYV